MTATPILNAKLQRLTRLLYRHYIKGRAFFLYGDADFPRTIRFEISSHCNRRCNYCPNSFAPGPVEFVSDELLGIFLRRISEIRWGGAVDFIFFNEPTLHPQLVQIVQRVKAAAPSCLPVLTSNGDLLTLELTRNLVSAGVVRIFTMHHRPPKPGWWENMHRLQAAYPSVIQASDITELENSAGLYDYAGRVEVAKVRQRTRLRGVVACDMHENCAQIDIHGDWLLCCVDYSRSIAFGNIRDESLVQTWNSPRFRAIRQQLRTGSPTLDICRQCTCFTGR